MGDELHIIIRKQLSHSSPKYKQIGVVSALAVLSSIASAYEAKRYPRWGADAMNGSFSRAATELLQLVHSGFAWLRSTIVFR